MTLRVQKLVVAVTLASTLMGAGWVAHAQTEKHPVLRNSIRQLEGMKDRLQHAPNEFGGHKAAAIESINRATAELREAIEYDRR